MVHNLRFRRKEYLTNNVQHFEDLPFSGEIHLIGKEKLNKVQNLMTVLKAQCKTEVTIDDKLFTC